MPEVYEDAKATKLCLEIFGISKCLDFLSNGLVTSQIGSTTGCKLPINNHIAEFAVIQ